MTSTASGRRRLLHLGPEGRTWTTDSVVVEEPMEVRVGGVPVAVTMRTPGHDFDLAVGFLLTEGIISGAEQIAQIKTCEVAADGRHNILEVELAGSARGFDPAAARAFYVSSSCGLCGRASLDAVRTRARWQVADDPVAFTAEQLTAMPGRLREAQRVFERTGGLHAAALFDAEGTLHCVREDVGRHNAFDKVIGWAATDGRLPLRSHLLLASGRASFELVQKALLAGVPMVAAVSAPSSLAVELAEEAGMTLVGFLRDGGMNVYAGHQRVVTPAP
ncbi:MAG TPA: formate dehydrogenase accessory sulfurtransferase FdhD [Candidatus Dormibacteraeota bacterium]|jgi:FdhD protein|nr:formate dehydrogenase accessory sulfurtransferase FdhD [Candidatus Dormibacteraeota bacterium]